MTRPPLALSDRGYKNDDNEPLPNIILFFVDDVRLLCFVCSAETVRSMVVLWMFNN